MIDRRLEEREGTETGLEGGEVLVGPVSGFEVGRDVGFGCSEKVEQEEKVDAGEVGVVC